MRGFFVIAVILHRFFTPGHSGGAASKPDGLNLKFGDIVSMSADARCGVPFSKHYAVYVGEEPFEGKDLDQNIFHRLFGGPKNCIFSRLKDSYTKATEYDVTNDQTTKDLMVQRIKQLREDCGEYNQETNNCEQVATYVRYNQKLLLQKGTTISAFLWLCPKGASEECDKYKEMIANAKVELEGWQKAKKNNCEVTYKGVE